MIGISRRYANELLQESGKSFAERVLELRLQKARVMLANASHDRAKIIEIAFACGFNDVSYFHRCFRRRFELLRQKSAGRIAPGASFGYSLAKLASREATASQAPHPARQHAVPFRPEEREKINSHLARSPRPPSLSSPLELSARGGDPRRAFAEPECLTRRAAFVRISPCHGVTTPSARVAIGCCNRPLMAWLGPATGPQKLAKFACGK